MKITTIQISGFRKILKATINMEDDITVIAGANNSGKTSIVELFNYVFNAKGALCSDDFPVYESQEWCTAVFPYFQAQFKQENKKDDLIANILGTIVPSENPENEMLLTPIEVLIQVDYDPAGDDIRNFADYIMELDPDNSSFYFIYRFELDKDLLRKYLDSEYEKLCNRFDKLVGDDDKDAEGIRIIKEMLIQIYTDSCKDAAYFSDKTYSNIVPMDVASFRGLFNYQNIMAGRTLDDGNSDRAKILSKNMIDIASQEDNWKTLIQSLPDKIKQSIEDEQIQQEVRKASIETLGKTIEQISKTNGGQAGNITIDMVVTDEAVQSLLKSITSAKYQVDNFFLRESSQGLGYSNLIFIHLQLEKYRKTIDPLLVNFFVIEEPEAHMHPQMQNVFSQYLFAYYSKESAMQGFVTTHSHKLTELVPVVEVVHVADYLCNPRVSTQHGVKGESHDSVVFVAEDSSNNPCVAMYRFFEMWGQIPISAKTLNQFYYDFAAEVDNTQRSIGIKGSELNKKIYMENEEMIKEKLHTVFDRFKDDPYFQFIYGADYESYFSKPGVTKARDCLKGNTAYSILSTYKLFYVGCSRARRNLTILLDSSKIKGNLEPQKKRFEEIGFQVVSSPIH